MPKTSGTPSSSINQDTEMTADDTSAKAVRKFIVPEINIYVELHQNMVDFDVTEPPATTIMNDEAIQNFETSKLVLDHPCHSQTVERHVKLVTEAFKHMAGFERRYGMMPQKIKSRKLMPSFNTKKQFNC